MGRRKKNIIENTLNCNCDNQTLDKQTLNNKIIKCTKSNKISDSETSTQENNIIEINNFKKKEKMLYDVINDFFKKCSQEEINKIINIIDGKYKISLRFLDWFVTRYCYLYKTSIQINNIYNKEIEFNINISYKAQLKSFKKKCFDPFKRKNKFYYTFGEQNLNTNNNLILTTLGQLNFFKWALSFDVIKYVENNFDNINNKISYVNSFFKKNIIDNGSISIISSDEIKSKQSFSDTDIQKVSNLNSDLDSKKINIENKIQLEPKKKYSINYPVVSRNIFVEL